MIKKNMQLISFMCVVFAGVVQLPIIARSFTCPSRSRIVNRQPRKLIKLGEIRECPKKPVRVCCDDLHAEEQSISEHVCFSYDSISCPSKDATRYRSMPQIDEDLTVKSPIVGPGFGFGERSSSFTRIGLGW